MTDPDLRALLDDVARAILLDTPEASFVTIDARASDDLGTVGPLMVVSNGPLNLGRQLHARAVALLAMAGVRVLTSYSGSGCWIGPGEAARDEVSSHELIAAAARFEEA